MASNRSLGAEPQLGILAGVLLGSALRIGQG